ncbi:hypothetical protein NVP1081O_143 [Vibrio phage 1.081.O._10N.286.52.C2]|nr:hypothetical protein NVP1081O_143 [Vibrio phage 1.081.O._10N.286.52.C2]
MNENVRLLEITATGHYSDATAAQTCWVTQEFVEKYEEPIGEWSFTFSELDGKHSETEGELFIHSTPRDMALAWSVSQGEHWAFTEDMFDHEEFESADVSEMISLNEDLNSMIDVKTETIITIGDHRIVV